MTKSGVKLAALFMMISDIQSIGLPAAHGLQLTEAFYWDLNDNTRVWSNRFAERMNGRMPTQDHAGVYSATLALRGALGRACWWLAPLHELMLSTVLSSPKVFADDTTLPVLDPGNGRTKTGRLWCYAVDNRPWQGPAHPVAADA